MHFLARGALDWSDRCLGEQPLDVHAKTEGSMPSFTESCRWLSMAALGLLFSHPPLPLEAHPAACILRLGFHCCSNFLHIAGNV